MVFQCTEEIYHLHFIHIIFPFYNCPSNCDIFFHNKQFLINIKLTQVDFIIRTLIRSFFFIVIDWFILSDSNLE